MKTYVTKENTAIQFVLEENGWLNAPNRSNQAIRINSVVTAVDNSPRQRVMFH